MWIPSALELRANLNTGGITVGGIYMSKKALIFLFVIPILFSAIALPAAADTGRISPGESMDGELRRGDSTLDDDCYYDTYILECDQGTLLRITQTSDEIDSYLMVVSPRGTQWDNDDYSFETGFDSRLTILTSERGDYEINCSSYSPESGDYTLIVEEIPAPGDYGIFIGIENYGSEFEDAPRCDDDAVDLYDSFVESGLMDRDNGIVITNRDAELDQVEDAFREMEDMAGPDDVFVFFFSGHGTQVECDVRNRDGEMDDLDEAIALLDVDLTDNQLADLLGDLDAKLKVVVLDACNSGGVARDVVNGPGIVCYASSEEDVLSDFAPELRAGGYLSVFFREAIEGEGDLDGDGIIMIGELSHYLLRRYYQEIEDPYSATDGYQELVHERGLVKQDEIFVWWSDDTIRSDRDKP